MSHKSDLYHPIGYGPGQQHLGKSQVPEHEKVSKPQAGLNGQEGSRICGQAGPELLGGSASTRILGQSIDEQMNKPLPSSSRQ